MNGQGYRPDWRASLLSFFGVLCMLALIYGIKVGAELLLS